MDEAEVLYFHAKLWDAASKSGANTEHHGNIIVFVWAYKVKYTCFREYFLLFTTSKITEKLTLPKRLMAQLQLFFVDVTIIVLTQQICIMCFTDLELKLNISIKCKIYVHS